MFGLGCPVTLVMQWCLATAAPTESCSCSSQAVMTVRVHLCCDYNVHRGSFFPLCITPLEWLQLNPCSVFPLFLYKQLDWKGSNELHLCRRCRTEKVADTLGWMTHLARQVVRSNACCVLFVLTVTPSQRGCMNNKFCRLFQGIPSTISKHSNHNMWTKRYLNLSLARCS